MRATLKFRCPECDARLCARDRAAGRTLGCPNCEAPVTEPCCTALVPVQPQPIVVPDRPHGKPARPLTRRRSRKSSTPVELRLPGRLGGLKARVDRRTGNMMATTFLGGVLVAIGAVLFSMFGGKSKTA